MFSGYDRLRFVLTTRDLTVSVASRIRRFGGTSEEYREDNQRAALLFRKLLEQEDCFIWNYETMCALGRPYFQRLYRWLDVSCDFIPDVEDANRRYFKADAVR